jgi:hypothetical protein
MKADSLWHFYSTVCPAALDSFSGKPFENYFSEQQLNMLNITFSINPKKSVCIRSVFATQSNLL